MSKYYLRMRIKRNCIVYWKKKKKKECDIKNVKIEDKNLYIFWLKKMNCGLTS